MQKVLIFVSAVFLLSCANSSLQNATNTKDPIDGVYQPDELQKDLNFLWETLHEVHPDIYALTSRHTLEKKYKEVLAQLDHPMTSYEYFLIAAPLIANIKDGHTFLSAPIRAQHIIQNELVLFPLDLAVIKEKTYILRDYSQSDSGLNGAELLAIDQTPISELIDDFTRIMNRETMSFTLHSLESDIFKILLWMKHPRQSIWNIRYKPDNSDSIKTSYISGITGTDIVRARNRITNDSQPVYTLYFYDQDVAVIKLQTFSDKNVLSFYRKAFREINKSDIQKLVIDLRDNLGGYTSNVDELLSYLIDEPILPMPKIQIKLSEYLKERNKSSLPEFLQWIQPNTWRNTSQSYWDNPDGKILNVYLNKYIEPKPKRLHFDGQVYVLTNGHSFSTGAHFPSLVKEYGLGRVVGVETGGLVGGSFGEHIVINLPETRLPLGISTSILKHGNSGDFKSHGVIPDYHIHRDIKREIQGVDSQLEKTIQFIRSAPDSSSN